MDRYYFITGVVLSMLPKFSPFYSARNKKWWTWYLAIVTFIVFFFFAADFGSFSYNQTPLDAGAMNFAEDFRYFLENDVANLSDGMDDTGIGGGCIFFPVDVSSKSLAGDQ